MPPCSIRLRLASLATLGFPCLVGQLNAQQWTAPTPEELSMTSIPQVPGAPAVYLYKEQTTDDGIHMFSFYVRLKVLTDRGKDYANVELPYQGGSSGFNIDSIAGRTIHPDGTIISLTDKPYDKLVVKAGGIKVKEKVFTLPSVDVGSIIEYRYKYHMDDHMFYNPDWIIQSDLYTRKAHYMWRPTSALLTSEDGKESSRSVVWTPILPPGAKIEMKPLFINTTQSDEMPRSEITLDVHDVEPILREEYMPPIESLSYRVLFYYTDVRTQDEYWHHAGKNWSKVRDKFIGPNNGVKAYVATLIAPGDTQDQKARKLYAAVMQLENTDFTRERTSSEEKASGLKQVANTDDILARKRGNGDQLDLLFIAMCRAAGLKAYLMGVADRQERVFLPSYLSLRQLDDDIAIVSIDGKEVFFDPGQRYCEPEHLSWRHSLAGGLRQTDNGPQIYGTPVESYKDQHISRVADLTLDEQGIATGTVKFIYSGDPALHWRQEALKGDDTSLNEDLRSTLERMLPGGLEIHVTSVDGLATFDKPLTVTYSVKGPIGSPTGKRLLVPANLFESNAKPRFPEPKRQLVVDMHYASYTQDAVRIKYPAGLTVESAPAPEKAALQELAIFSTSTKTAPDSITMYRNLLNGRAIYQPAIYDDLRKFYSKVETKDQETLVLTRTPAPATADANTKPTGN